LERRDGGRRDPSDNALDPIDGADLHPWSERRRSDPAQLEERLHSAAVRAERFEQLEHPLVSSAWLASERPRNDVRNVIVADRHGVRVAERDPGDLGDAPWTDPLERTDACLRQVEP
jgi:hypothetical protein